MKKAVLPDKWFTLIGNEKSERGTDAYSLEEMGGGRCQVLRELFFEISQFRNCAQKADLWGRMRLDSFECIQTTTAMSRGRVIKQCMFVANCYRKDTATGAGANKNDSSVVPGRAGKAVVTFGGELAMLAPASFIYGLGGQLHHMIRS